MRYSIDCDDHPSGVATVVWKGVATTQACNTYNHTYDVYNNVYCDLPWFAKSCKKSCGLCDITGK